MPTQFNTLCQESTLYEAWSIVKSKGSAGGIDGVNIYPLCTECYARIEYIPPVKKKEPVKIAVI